MPQLILLILIVMIINHFAQSIGAFFTSLLTLSFLPHGLGIFDGNLSTYYIPILGLILNYLFAAIINIIDFLVWLVIWIPGVKPVLQFIAKSPDLLEQMLPDLFPVHRNMITHSVLNPVFLLICLLGRLIAKVAPKLFIIPSLCVLVFFAYLLTDTMPKSWSGFANIHAYVIVFPPLLSSLWLHINSFAALFLYAKISGEK